MAKDDLFTWLDSLWTKKRLAGTPPLFVMHRFLASDRDYAVVARHLQRDLKREPELVAATWRALLPRGRGAPRLQYVVAKKGPEAEALTARMQSVLAVRREVAEQMQEIVRLAGRERELYATFGVETP